MKYVFLSVEGQTERNFVTTVLAEVLAQKDIWVNAVPISTGKTKHGHKFRGGLSTYQQARYDINCMLTNPLITAVTT
ncbi:MAG: hypothetical protein ACYC6L_14140, partial [Anaerolineae bacterium]